ncbi:unnamed protein product [Mytilus coruscus]|uniref:B box-type domain-containing protein n=1 Tax=Mytilus coruscus TaxID=42192 RepID=A0A6J8A351_MYTCO|nr:unnamed protein product [Mytilus coruscus]
MASSSSILCGPCEYRHVTQKADFWCSVCEEGLCRNCHGHHTAIKSTRDHEIMLIKAYKTLAKGLLSVNMECDLHNEKFELNLNERLQNLDGLIKNGTDNLIDIDTDKENIKTEVSKVRVDIENKLGILETKILADVDSIHYQHKTGIVDTVSKLQQKRDALSEALIDFENLHKNASDFHIYMAMKKLETDLLEEGKEINSLLLQEGMKLQRLFFSPNADLLSSVSETVSLGNIAVRTKPFPYWPNIIIISVQLKRRLSGYSVSEEEDINISSIIVLLDRKILLADFGDDGGILLFGENGHFITKMKQFGKPYGTALIDDSRMAVSFPKNGNIKILKLGSRFSLIKTLQLDVDLNTISYYGKHIIVC